jgi:hypothetical protein
VHTLGGLPAEEQHPQPRLDLLAAAIEFGDAVDDLLRAVPRDGHGLQRLGRVLIQHRHDMLAEPHGSHDEYDH